MHAHPMYVIKKLFADQSWYNNIIATTEAYKNTGHYCILFHIDKHGNTEVEQYSAAVCLISSVILLVMYHKEKINKEQLIL